MEGCSEEPFSAKAVDPWDVQECNIMTIFNNRVPSYPTEISFASTMVLHKLQRICVWESSCFFSNSGQKFEMEELRGIVLHNKAPKFLFLFDDSLST